MLKVFCGIRGVGRLESLLLNTTRRSLKKVNLTNSLKNSRGFHQHICSCYFEDNNMNMEGEASFETSTEAHQKNHSTYDVDKMQAEGNEIPNEQKKNKRRRGKRHSKKKHDSESSDQDSTSTAEQELVATHSNQGNGHSKNGSQSGNRSRNNSGNYHSPQGRNPQKANYKLNHGDTNPSQNHYKSPQKSNHQRNKLPEINFEDYITHEECSEGLKRGELIRGVLRINPKSYQDGYIDGTPGERDINIEGIEMRNRALPGDVIAVQLLPRDKWKRGKDQVEEATKESNDVTYFAKTGKVVYIIEKKHARVSAGHLNPFRNHAFGFALLSPVDNRLPRLMIPLNECPQNFRNRPKDCEKTLFVARIISWGLNMPFASGKLMRSLGEAGHIEPETEAIIMANNIDSSDFKEDVLRCLPEGDTWEITKEELAKRKDLRRECIFTIDPATARDLDDALSCKKIADDLYEVGVHIADVSHFIEEGNALDEVAMERATSVYLAQRVIPMLPRVLCEKLCSLNPGVDRLAYSVIWNMKSDGTIVKEWFGRSVICSAAKLSYDHAQQMIDNTSDSNIDETEFPPVHGEHTLKKICAIVKNMYGISAHMRKLRFDSGALKIDMPKLAFSLNDQTGLPNGCRVYEYKNSNEMIEEFMLCANMAVGRRTYKFNPKDAILRLHPPPHGMMMQDLSNLCKQFEIPFDIRDSASINASLHKVLESHPESAEYMYHALTLMCAKPFQNAKYFCTGSIDDESVYRHYALNVPIYTHFTSPIRRYPDVLVHRLLTASLDIDFKINKNVKELQIIADHCNDKKWAAKKASEASSLLFFAVYVKECGPLTEKGVVVGILDKAIDVLSVRLGITNRVYIDQLPLSKHEYKLDKLKPQMTLYWQDNTDAEKGSLDDRLAALTKQFEQRWQNKNESTNEGEDCEGKENIEGSIKQELTIFSPVELILCVKENPTKIIASIRNPHEENDNPTHGL